MKTILLLTVGVFSGWLFASVEEEREQQESTPYEATLCKYGEGTDGEYHHFRRKKEGMPLVACSETLQAYTNQYKIQRGTLFCSPTKTCPE